MNEAIEPPARKPGPNTVAGAQARNQLGRWEPGDNRRELTERQAAFALAYARNGGNGSKAAISAGYAPGGAAEAASRLIRLPWVIRAIEIERKGFLAEAELASLGYVVGVIRDAEATAAIRLKAAEVALKAVARERDGQKNTDGAGKRLNEMSIGELEALIRRLDQAAELAQQPIVEGSVEPPAEITGQDIDPIE
jgi:hypothetical protein